MKRELGKIPEKAGPFRDQGEIQHFGEYDAFGDQWGNAIQDAAHGPLREDTTQRDKRQAPHHAQLVTTNKIPGKKRNSRNHEKSLAPAG